MISQTVRELLEQHVTLEQEGIDRIYLNGYVPMLQTGGGVSSFFKQLHGAKVVSTTLMAPMSRGFVASIETFAKNNGIEIVRFKKGERKDDITLQRLKDFKQDEGVLYIGKAQEKFSTFRVYKRNNPETGQSYPWLMRSPVVCNQYYFYLVDEDFGPLFIKFSGYFPYTARICLNGHDYLKRQLEKEGIGYQPLDNGILSCADPARMQQIADELDAVKIESVIRKWFSRLPCAFTNEERAAGFDYDISILQAEFARTQVFDRPLSGRYLFEEIIRENLDIGRPEQVSLIFNRRVTRRTPGIFRTRVITEGVDPSLHISYKRTKIKQYFKLGRALRTETTLNNARDFGIGKRLKNLPALREIGFEANRRLLDVQKVSQDCRMGEETFERITQPQKVDGQHASALKFADPRVMVLFQVLCLFCLIPAGFRNANLRTPIANLLGIPVEDYTAGKMTYDLRRLRLHGIIVKIPHSHRYRVTDKGLKICLFFTKVHCRIFRSGFAQLEDGLPEGANRQITAAMNKLDKAIDRHFQEAKI